MKLKMYIDGFNLYHAIVALNDQPLKWLNPVKLAESLMTQGENLSGIEFFTSIKTADGQKYKRHINYLRAIQSVGVHTHRGKFIRIDRKCVAMDRSCFFHEEKRTDVAIALKVLSDAYSDAYDHVILLTSDSDQVPTIQAVRDTFPQKRITVAIPPGRAAIARELAAIAHRHVEITPSRLAACMFGRNVYDASGKFVAAMPALYLEDERG